MATFPTVPAPITTDINVAGQRFSRDGDSYVLNYDYQIDRRQRISPTGAAIIAEPKRLVGGGFAGSLDTMAWTAANSGAGSSTTVTFLAALQSGTANAGYASIQAANVARFLFASANNFRGTFRMAATGVANSVAKWGAFNYGSIPAIADGFYFAYDGTTFSVNCVNGGVVNQVNSGSFNGDVSTFTMDLNAHNYEIIYQVAATYFFVDNVLLHKFKPATTPLSSNAHLAATSLVVNTAASAGLLFEVWASNIVRLGSADSSPQSFHSASNTTTVLKIGPGSLRRIAANAAGAGGNNVTIYDNTAASGKILGIVSQFSGTIEYDLDFYIGLTIISAGGTPADLTFIFE